MNKEAEIWNSLLEVDNTGVLKWRLEYEDQEYDWRRNPERFIARCGSLKPFSEFSSKLRNNDLIPDKRKSNEYFTNNPENVRVDGLLRLVDLFPTKLKQPKKVLLIGALTPNSFYALLSWLKEEDWQNTDVEVIDKSPFLIETIRLMQEVGLFSWAGRIDLRQEDFYGYQTETSPDLIIGDILNTWLVPNFFDPRVTEDPYKGYKDFLDGVKDVLQENGRFLSRCLVLSEDRTLDPVPPSSRSSGYPTSISDNKNLVPALRGREVENQFINFYEEKFSEVNLITVFNSRSGYTHLNFLCR